MHALSISIIVPPNIEEEQADKSWKEVTTLVSFVQDDGRKEVELKAGATIKITTNDEFKEKCTADLLWVDYKNITKVLSNFNHSVQ